MSLVMDTECDQVLIADKDGRLTFSSINCPVTYIIRLPGPGTESVLFLVRT